MSDEMDEIWALYADDGAQALDAMETALLALGDGGAADAGAHVGALFRAVHTFKGNSRVLGLSVVESRAHYAEDLIGLVRDQGVPWDAEIKDILLLASDTLRLMLEETAATRADVAPAASEDLMRRLKDKIARASGAAPKAAVETAPQPTPITDPEPTPTPAPEAITAPQVKVVADPVPKAAPEDAPEPTPKKRGKKAASPEAAAAFLADAPPAPEQAAEPTPAPPAQEAPKKRLADDPAYREIFRSMAADATRKLTALLDSFDADAHARARKECDTLRHAARQMGLDDWAAPLSLYIDGADAAPDALAALLGELAALTAATFGDATPATPETKPAAAAHPPAKPLADDPAYREIFKGMVTDTTRNLTALLSAFDGDAHARARKESDNLRHAARQMGMDDWSEALTTFLHSTAENSEPLAALLLSLQELAERTFGTPKPAQTETKSGHPGFFDRIRDPLADIATFGTGFFCGETPDPTAVADRVSAIRAAAQSHRYVRVDEAAARIPATTTAQDFHAAELRLYEELAGVEAVMPEAARASGISPREMLQGWCAEHVFSSLSELEATLERLKEGLDLDSDYLRFDRLMRLVHHACGHHGIETAGQLAMSLIDLFSRLHTRGQTPDAILSHVARGFIDTVEIVFDAITQGQTPDTASLEKLFEEASNLCFVQDGLMTASAIERRLGLPKEFHRVLSPESVRSASECIEQGLRFFILRADINSDESLAEAFIGWLSSDAARAITNVTVFQGSETLFDFLLASPLDEAGMGETLAALDPSTRKLRLTRMLVPTEATPESAPIDPETVAQMPQASISAEMVEQIGEIAASQSMISHMLGELAEGDLFDRTEAVLRAAGGDWKRARPQMRALLTGFTTRLQELAQLETQLVGQITRLQEETVEIRSRRIETIFRPLEAFIQTYSRKNRHEAATSFVGGDITLDIGLLENLRRLLRNLAVARLELGQGAPRKIHVSFHRDEERVLAIFEDDGMPTETSPALDEVRATVTRHGGDLRHVALPGTGIRVHISLPLAMVVLEGMVVGVEGVRYVVPVDAIRMILQPEADRRIRVSAAEGREMLRIAENEIVAVRSLPGPRTSDAPSSDRRNVYVVVGAQGRSVAVPVDELIGQQLVLLRPLKGVLSGLRNLTGIALLAGGDVGMVVSANMLCAAQATHPISTSLRM
jgi:two-component system chemotaxis sensor kinase CheA